MSASIIDDRFLASIESLDLFIKGALGGNFGGNRKTKAYGSSTEFADFREYVPGDDLRRIDWNVFGRFGLLMLKLFLDERQLHTKIYIDVSASMGNGSPKKSMQALRLAAAIGYMSVRAMDKITYYLVRGKTCESLCGTIVGKESFYRAAELLGEVSFEGEVELGDAISLSGTTGRGDGVSFVISDFLTDADWKSGIDFLLYNKRQVSVLQVLSPDEINPSYSGKMMFLDSEGVGDDDRRHSKMIVSRSVVEAYKRAYDWFVGDIKKFCLAREASYLMVRSDEDTGRALLARATAAEVLR